jgi:hypothetical protein
MFTRSRSDPNRAIHMRCLLIVVLVGVMAIGCSKSAKETYCDDRDDVRESVDDLAMSVSSADVSRIEDSVSEVREDIDDLDQSAQKVDGPPVAELENDFNQLAAVIEQFGQGGGDLRSNLQAVQAPLSEFAATLSSFVQAYDCD